MSHIFRYTRDKFDYLFLSRIFSIEATLMKFGSNFYIFITHNVA